ncbi:CmpA/NrtA family ABC transporter substrate-binding protein [Thalassotalea euphylliae]|uniref:CmpA/NrtA family ABC transporter substrate-binding protein n=1 Tax=Thalassotalea euphylliae TaxID=1655234 RepID=UPI00362F143A
MSQSKKFDIEQHHVKLGFMPLSDCAPIIVAYENGYFLEQGLSVTLKKQYSWATMRDKLHAGVLDAAQFLAPMPLASTLGMHGEPVDVIAGMVLSQNGNAITLSMPLYEELKFTHQTQALQLPLSASLLKPIIEQRRSAGKKLRFATVFPFSCHYYQLSTWFEQNNVAMEDIEIVIIPPASMVEALQAEDIDGFCVGGPWNAKAVRDGVGVTCVTSCDIWPNVPEKVLALKSKWQQDNPESTKAIIYALKKACDWLSFVGNRFEAARMLSQHNYLDLHVSVIAPSLIGSCLVHHELSPRSVPNYNRFSGSEGDTINQPDYFHGEWLLNHMRKHNHVKQDIPEDLVSAVYRPDIYRDAISGKTNKCAKTLSLLPSTKIAR